MSNKPRLISGIQPTGRLHLGNYLGALKNFVELQNSDKHDCLFFIADLHSLTEAPTAEELEKNIGELARTYLQAGLDPKKSIIFRHSEVPAHSELMYILSSVTSEGDLRRMTQYKDKVRVKKYEANAGLLFYPVLMAADILLYDAKFVPVGDDQNQHLELARRIVRKFNKKYGETFTEPEALLTNAPRVMSLSDPENKMSKSAPAGCLFLDDSEKEILKKVKRAVTDSGNEVRYSPEKKPAVSNLILIYAEVAEMDVKNVEKEFSGKSYGELKEALANLLVEKLKPFRETKISDKEIKSVLETGRKHAEKTAEKKIKEVKEKMGLGQ